MSWIAEVLPDSPWAAWRTDEPSGNLIDASGNGRNMTRPLGDPTYEQVGPDGSSLDALLWATGTSYARTTATVGGTITAATVETTFYYDGAPGSFTCLGGFTYLGTSDRPMELFLDTTGKVNLWWGNGSGGTVITAPAPPDIGWHLAAGVVSGSTGKLRLDKVDVASGARTLSLASSALFAIHRGENGPSSLPDLSVANSEMLMGHHAAWLSAVSDARLDAHYDASGIAPPGPVAIADVWGLVG